MPLLLRVRDSRLSRFFVSVLPALGTRTEHIGYVVGVEAHQVVTVVPVVCASKRQGQLLAVRH